MKITPTTIVQVNIGDGPFEGAYLVNTNGGVFKLSRDGPPTVIFFPHPCKMRPLREAFD